MGLFKRKPTLEEEEVNDSKQDLPTIKSIKDEEPKVQVITDTQLINLKIDTLVSQQREILKTLGEVLKLATQ